MRPNKVAIALISLFLVSVLFFFHIATAQDSTRESITVVGVVTDDSELLTENGIVYEIAGNSKGTELSELPGAHVSVKGKLLEFGQKRLILVVSYRILSLNKARTG